MIIGRLCISFDRGVGKNIPPDIGLERAPTYTQNGGIVRGLGTHYRSEAARELAKERSNEEARVRAAFRRDFVASPIPGTYILPSKGAGQRLLYDLGVREDLDVRVAEYVLEPTEELPPAEVMEWAGRVEQQLQSIPFGRGKEVGADGLRILERLAACPALGKETAVRLRGLINATKLEAIDRVELRRRLADFTVEVEAVPVAPRRAPVSQDTAENGQPIVPRRAPVG